MRIALCAEPGAPLVRCLWSLGMKSDIATSARADLLKRDAPDSLARVVLYAIRQMLAIDRKQRPSTWEDDVQALLRFYTFAESSGSDQCAPHQDRVLQTMFLVAMEAQSAENVYPALRFLGSAVHVESSVCCSYSTVCRVLSAAEQWIGKHVWRDTTSWCSADVPQVYMSAFAIVAHCALCLITGKITIPPLQEVRIEEHYSRVKVALGALPRFLPTEDALAKDDTLCNELLWGLTLLLRPLRALSCEKPGLVGEEVVISLEAAWAAAKPSLVPWVAPRAEPRDKEVRLPSLSVPERLSALQEDAAKCFDPFGMSLESPQSEGSKD
ncbi:hypothetical protein C8Q77DRAFT_200789 [Trametes polyzona]|nr:hypothetical protein C8Q77DRAFT_200789 [Trametes polyzona]